MLVLELDNEDELEKVDDEEEERDVITVREFFARSIIFEEKMKKGKTMQELEQKCAAVFLKQWIVLHKHPVGCQ